MLVTMNQQQVIFFIHLFWDFMALYIQEHYQTTYNLLGFYKYGKNKCEMQVCKNGMDSTMDSTVSFGIHKE